MIARSYTIRVPRLLDALALARGDGRYPRLLKSLARVELLILDDWDWHRSPHNKAATCSTSSMIAMVGARRSSPAKSPSSTGMS